MFSKPPKANALKPKGTGPQPVGNIGELLLDQLRSTQNFSDGYDSTVEIAKYLSPKKQITFITEVAKNCGLDDKSPKMKALYDQLPIYTDALNKMEEATAKKKSKKVLKQLKEELKQAEKALNLSNYYSLLKTTLVNKPKNLKVNWDIHLKALFKPSGNYPEPLDFYNAPVYKIQGSTPGNPKIPTKLDLQKRFALDPDMNHSLYVSPKSGGKNDPGLYGGHYLRCYQDVDGKIHPQLMLTKQATDDGKATHREVIAEVLGGLIMNFLAGNTAGSIYLSVRPGGKQKEPNDIYLTSIFFDGAKMVHDAAHEILPEYTDGTKSVPKRPGGMNAGANIDSHDPDFRKGCIALWQLDDASLEKTSLSKGLMASIAIGNYQVHSENVCIGDFPDSQTGKTRRAFGIFDFGGAFRRTFGALFMMKSETGARFERGVHPEESSGKKLAVSYFAAYPLEVRRSEEFIKGIDAEADINKMALARAISSYVDYIVDFYGEEEFVDSFASELDPSNKILKPKKPYTALDMAAAIDATKSFVTDTIVARQYSIKEFAMESKLEHIQLWTAQGKTPAYTMEKLIQDHPISFILGNNSKLKPDQVCDSFSQNSEGGELDQLNDFLIEQLSLRKDRTSPTDRRLVINDFIKLLERAEPFIETTNTKDQDELDTLHAYLSGVLSGKHGYNLSKADDQKVTAQACDETYQLIAKVYQKANLKGYFLSCLSGQNNQLALHGEPDPAQKLALDSLKADTPNLLGEFFDYATPSKDLEAFAKQLLSDCKATAAVDTIEQTHTLNDPFLQDWENLPADTKNDSFYPFMEGFYKKVIELTFDNEGELSPWLIQALGYDKLNTATALYGSNEVKMQLFLAVSKLITDSLTVSAANDKKLAAFLPLALHFVEERTHSLTQHFEDLKDLEYLNHSRHRKLYTLDTVSQANQLASENFSDLLRDPLKNDFAQLIVKLSDEKNQLYSLVMNEREEEKILTETRSTRTLASSTGHYSHPSFLSATPMAMIAADSQATTATADYLQTVEFQTKHHTSRMEVSKRSSQNSHKPVFDLTKLDESLDTADVFAKTAHAQYAHLLPSSDFESTKDFFKTAIEEMKTRYNTIDLNALSRTLAAALPAADKTQLQEVAVTLIQAYKNNFEQLDPIDIHKPLSEEKNPYARTDYYPSDLLIRMAYHHLNSYKQSTGDEHPPVLINQAWDPHYVEALILVATREGCIVTNNSGWNKIDHLAEKKKNFNDFFEERFGKTRIDIVEEKDAAALTSSRSLTAGKVR